MPTQLTTIGPFDVPDGVAVHPDAIHSRDCVSAQCTDCAETFPDNDYAYHFNTRAELVEAIGPTDWHLGPDALRCANCAPEGAAGSGAAHTHAADAYDWFDAVLCVAIQCTRCHRTLESDRGEAHFASVHAAAEAALSARWLLSAHKVWCRTCTALVHGGDGPNQPRTVT